MAKEASIIELLGNAGEVMSFTVADDTGIPKGTILTLGSDPRTAVASAAAGVFAGIAAAEKVADDGSVNLGAYTKGVFDLKATGSITLGTLVSLSGANLVKQATATEVEGGKIVGKCLETAADAETVAVAVGVY